MSFVKNKNVLSFGCFVTILLLGYSSSYVVTEGHVALLKKTHATHTHYDVIGPGLHFKIPFFTHPEKIDLRLQNLSLIRFNPVTLEGYTPLNIEYDVKWQVSDPVLYYQRTRNAISKTEEGLTRLMKAPLQNASAHTAPELITHLSDATHTALHTEIQASLRAWGISLVDIGFKFIHASTETDKPLLENKRLEHTQLALQQQAFGKTLAENIRLSADNAATLTLEKANQEAALIRAQGDTEAAKIYSNAYQKNPRFAAFYLNLETYKKSFAESDINHNFLLLNTPADFFNTKENPRLTS